MSIYSAIPAQVNWMKTNHTSFPSSLKSVSVDSCLQLSLVSILNAAKAKDTNLPHPFFAYIHVPKLYLPPPLKFSGNRHRVSPGYF